MSRLVPKEMLPDILWNSDESVLILLPKLVSNWKFLLEKNGLYDYQLVNYLQHFKIMAENRKITMGHITQEQFEQSRIAISPRKLAEKLDKLIAPIFKNKMVNKMENQILKELRDWLLPMLMNGQVRVG